MNDALTTQEHTLGFHDTAVNFQYKARLFEMIFSSREELDDVLEMRLSDMYTVAEEDPQLELKALVFNINRGRNRPLMEACRTLRDYAEYTARVREYAAGMPVKEAVEKAVTECIGEGILAGFLEKNRAEVVKVSIYEYNAEEHMRMEKEESYSSGLSKGLAEGRASGEDRMARLVWLLADAGRFDDIKKAASSEAYRNELFSEFGL